MALLSAVDIGRMALSHLGTRTNIQALSEASTEAKAINRWYNPARKATLEAFDWDFARKRQILSMHGDAPPSGVWAYRYQYPSDCLAPRYIVNPVQVIPNQRVGFIHEISRVLGTAGNAVPYEVEDSNGTKSIMTNLEDAVLVYTFDQTAVSSFSNLFVLAFSHQLASLTAIELTGKASKQASELNLFFGLIRNAAATNANQEQREPQRDAVWIRGR